MKKTGVYKNKTGVVEGGIKALEKALKKDAGDKFKDWDGAMVRLCIMVPQGLRMAYKSKLAAIGRTIQGDLEDYVISTMTKK